MIAIPAKDKKIIDIEQPQKKVVLTKKKIFILFYSLRHNAPPKETTFEYSKINISIK